MFRYGATTLQANTWYSSPAYTTRTADLNIYVNGALDDGALIGTVRRPTGFDSERQSVGATSSGGFNFAGSIDKVRVYSRALTQAEIRPT